MASSGDLVICVKVVGVTRCVRTLLRLALMGMIATRRTLPLRARMAVVPTIWRAAREYGLMTAKVGPIEAAWWAAVAVSKLVWGTR